MRIILLGIALSLFELGLACGALAAPVETVLYNFKGGTDGYGPSSGLIADKYGNLYGTTLRGGSGLIGFGTVFKLKPPPDGETSWTKTVIYNFCSEIDSVGNCSDGVDPTGGLLLDNDGALYGTTNVGGSGKGLGLVFKLTPPAPGYMQWTQTVLYNFQGGSDGGLPYAGVISDENGNLYGTTALGGSSVNNGFAGFGTVFKLTPPTTGQTAWTETVLYSFQGGSDGANPQAGLIVDQSGALYSTTVDGGNNNTGTVFKLMPPLLGYTQWTENVLYSFQGESDGGAPEAGLIADEQGALYGTTYNSGAGSACSGGASGCGTVFKLSPPELGKTDWIESVLYSFKGDTDGSFPSAGLIADKQGALYSTTPDGGANGDGTVFKLSPPLKGQTDWTETVLYSFKGGNDGLVPYVGLIADNKGNLYGTAGGGAPGYGVVFELTNTGFVTEIPFAAFRSNLELQFGRRPNRDAFELQSEFTLGSTSTGFNLLTDPVTLTIGTYTATIAPGSFRRERDGQYYFSGLINGADLQAAIAQTGEKRFEFAAAAQKADLSGTTNPVPVTLTIGNNTGTDSIKHPDRGW